MTRERRIALLNILKESLIDDSEETFNRLERVVEDDRTMDIMFSFITMYAAEEPRFIEVLEYTVQVLKHGSSDSITN